MSAHLLQFNAQNGIPLVAHFKSADEMRVFYNGHPQGMAITTPAELDMAKQRYGGNGWVMPLLNAIDPKELG